MTRKAVVWRSVFIAALALHAGCDGSSGQPGGAGAQGGNGAGGGSGGPTGGGSPMQNNPDPSNVANAGSTPPGEACPSGTAQCDDSLFCCPANTQCLPNPFGQYCQAEYCCTACAGGVPCGAGCCPSGTECTVNDGSGACGSQLCCVAKGDPECPAAVAAQCPGGTTCVANKSAKACGDFACYTPDGFVACPGEVACPNGTDFCPSGLHCFGLSDGVCEQQSSSGNYCCKALAGAGDSCDVFECEPGTICVPNPHCPDSHPTAQNVCHDPACNEVFTVDCGNYCCAPDFPVCAGNCYCNTQ